MNSYQLSCLCLVLYSYQNVFNCISGAGLCLRLLTTVANTALGFSLGWLLSRPQNKPKVITAWCCGFFFLFSGLSAQDRVQRDMATVRSNATGVENISNCSDLGSFNSIWRTGLGLGVLYAREEAFPETFRATACSPYTGEVWRFFLIDHRYNSILPQLKDRMQSNAQFK